MSLLYKDLPNNRAVKEEGEGRGEMAKARFYIKDKVQEVGYRVRIMQKILNSGLKGTVINLADGRVEVRLEGEKERIEDFYEELKSGKNKPELAEKADFYDLEFNADLIVPDSMVSSQALVLEQLGKGIVYIAGMSERIGGMGDHIGNMSERMEGMCNQMGGMSDRMERMDENITGMRGEMRDGFKSLPKEMAKELKDLLEGKNEGNIICIII